MGAPSEIRFTPRRLSAREECRQRLLDDGSRPAPPRPGWLDGFTVTLDYRSVDLEDAIGSVGQDVYLQRCADGGEPLLCDRIERLADGSIDFVDDRTVNVAVERATGYDFEIEYVRRTAVGRADLLGTYLENRDRRVLPGEAPINGTGEACCSRT